MAGAEEARREEPIRDGRDQHRSVVILGVRERERKGLLWPGKRSEGHGVDRGSGRRGEIDYLTGRISLSFVSSRATCKIIKDRSDLF
jgi:hypothetical protein